MERLKRLVTSLEEGDDERVRALAAEALEAGLGATQVLNAGLLAGMASISARFGRREIFLPDVLLAARAMYAGLDVLQPHLARGDLPTRGKVVLGTVRGDLHDIGKNLVGIMLSGAGFEVIDLGHDVAPARFVEAAVDSGAPVIGLSALLTTTMGRMRDVVALVRERGLTGRVRTIVGGAPVTSEFAREIGADDYAYDAAHAVERVQALVGGDR